MIRLCLDPTCHQRCRPLSPECNRQTSAESEETHGLDYHDLGNTHPILSIRKNSNKSSCYSYLFLFCCLQDKTLRFVAKKFEN